MVALKPYDRGGRGPPELALKLAHAGGPSSEIITTFAFVLSSVFP